jgi:uncharacterized membrane protein
MGVICMMPRFWDHQGIDGWGHHLGAGGIVGMILMFILWAAVIVAIVLGIRALVIYGRRGGSSSAVSTVPGQIPPAPGGTEAPDVSAAAALPPMLAVLQERYARGEIDRKEFLQRKQDLGLS